MSEYSSLKVPELKKRPEEIKEILDEEEESFSRTLDRGEKLFEQYASAAKEQVCISSLHRPTRRPLTYARG